MIKTEAALDTNKTCMAHTFASRAGKCLASDGEKGVNV